MNFLPLITGATGLLAGLLIALILRKLFFEKDHVKLEQYNELANKANELETALKLTTQQFEDAKSEWNNTRNKLDEKSRELIMVSNEAARRKATLEMQAKQLEDTMTAKAAYQKKYEEVQAEWHKTRLEAGRLQSEFNALQTRMTEQQQAMEQYGTQLKNDFRLLADEVLQSKSNAFNEQQEIKLNDLLNPLRTRIQEFKSELENRFTQASTERTELATQIKMIHSLNAKLAQQAENLAKALTSQVKQQGDWGEGILETILQYVGLQKDIHYSAQHSGTNEEGKTIRPDFVVRYPDNRYIIIDSKVTLTHYARFCETNDAAEQALQLNMLVKSFRSHIDGLTARQYHHLEGSLDYVIAFIPVEGAFITAVQADGTLWQYAFDRRILLVSPTLLLATLKIIHELWKQDAINKNALQMADRAGKLYDKLSNFVANLDDIGAKLHAATKAFHDAKGQLHTGRGNLLNQAEELKKMGAKTNKQLPQGEQHDEA